MPRTALPLHAADISSFAKSLGKELATAHSANARPPGHQELLNMLARAAGHRNFQSLKARPPESVPPQRPPATWPDPAPEQPLSNTASRALRQFDAQGRVLRWPTRFSVQRLMLWGLWMRFDGQRRYTEREVNTMLNAWHLFGDHCTLRRELVNMRLLGREPDGSVYRKLPARPDAETMALLRALRAAAPARQAGKPRAGVN